MDNKHKVIQVNLKKSRSATEELTAHMLNNNIPIALVQEPYICRHGSNFKIPNLNGLQLAASTSAKFLTAIIYNKECASPLFIPQLSNNHIAVISAQLEKTQIFFAGVYLPPSTDIRTEIPALQRVVEATAGIKLVIGGDLSTRSTLWLDEKNDTRSPTLQEFVALNDLDIISKPGTLPTFQNAVGKSYIDLTLTTPSATPYIDDWKVSEYITMSDHNAVTFTCRIDTATNTTTEIEPKYAIDYIAETLQGWNDEFDAKFPDLPSPAKIAEAADFLYKSVHNCIDAKTIRRTRFAHRPDWWTDEIERHRKV
jgi:hypothetical protein